MSDAQELIDKIAVLLRTEKEIYGDFQLDGLTEKDLDAIRKTVQEAYGDSEHVTASKQKDSTPSSPEKKSMQDLLNECTTLDELRIFCEQSDELKTDLEGTNLVFGTGNPNADLMIIGEAPGAQEDKQGEPFVGRSGKLLTKILEAIKFSRDDIFIANILKHRPPDNRDPKPAERQRSLPYLYRQIEIINPKLILCLGRISAQTLLGNSEAMKDMRGTFHPFRGIELMVTYHPAALLRNPQWKRGTWEDVQKLRERYDELGCTP